MDIHIPDAKLHGKAELFASVNKAVAPGDGMFKDNDYEQYFSVGASALSAVIEALSAARLGMQNVKRVLDYACGYGRVLRWLRAAFPDAYLLGVDADRKAVEAASAVLEVETRYLDTSLAHPIDKPFDLIWIGSLITHLPEKETRRVLKYLKEHLTEQGVIVFTTHGQLVEQRLETRTRTYNLDEEGVKQTVEGF
jgi:trans-aconitate methyltransferase